MKKALCLFLVMLMVLTVLVACKTPEGPDNESDVTTEDPGQVTEPGNTNKTGIFDATEMKERHEDEGKVMNVLNWRAEHSEFEMTEEMVASDSVNDAIFERNNQVKNKLGLTNIAWTEIEGNSSNVQNFVQFVERVALNQDLEIDVIATYSRTAGLCAQKGFLLPINHYDKYINLENSWYPENLLNEINIGGNIYFVSGDISTNLLFLTYGFIFNKTLMDDLGKSYTDLYALVDEGKWTLAEMYKLVEDYYVDADMNGAKSDNDGYGLLSYNYHLDAFYTGSGLKLVEIDNNTTDPLKLVTISPDYGSQKAIDLNDRLGQLFTSDHARNLNPAKPFANNQNTIAEVTRVRDIREIVSAEKKMEYGVLPLPKYDEAQEDYHCVAGNPFTLWGIFSYNFDLEREESAAGFIEYMGYYGEQNTTEAIFEYLFKGRYADQPDDAVSFEIIRRTTTFDIGRIFTTVISPSAAIADQWSKCAATGAKWFGIYNTLIRGYSENAKVASQDFWDLKEEFKNPYEFPYEDR